MNLVKVNVHVCMYVNVHVCSYTKATDELQNGIQCYIYTFGLTYLSICTALSMASRMTLALYVRRRRGTWTDRVIANNPTLPSYILRMEEECGNHMTTCTLQFDWLTTFHDCWLSTTKTSLHCGQTVFRAGSTRQAGNETNVYHTFYHTPYFVNAAL